MILQATKGLRLAAVLILMDCVISGGCTSAYKQSEWVLETPAREHLAARIEDGRMALKAVRISLDSVRLATLHMADAPKGDALKAQKALAVQLGLARLDLIDLRRGAATLDDLALKISDDVHGASRRSPSQATAAELARCRDTAASLRIAQTAAELALAPVARAMAHWQADPESFDRRQARNTGDALASALRSLSRQFGEADASARNFSHDLKMSQGKMAGASESSDAIGTSDTDTPVHPATYNRLGVDP